MSGAIIQRAMILDAFSDMNTITQKENAERTKTHNTLIASGVDEEVIPPTALLDFTKMRYLASKFENILYDGTAPDSA